MCLDWIERHLTQATQKLANLPVIGPSAGCYPNDESVHCGFRSTQLTRKTTMALLRLGALLMCLMKLSAFDPDAEVRSSRTTSLHAFRNAAPTTEEGIEQTKALILKRKHFDDDGTIRDRELSTFVKSKNSYCMTLLK
ncbi:hypothetical protein MPSEU_000939800 [Mayamaea pseudoterrestris]|nr:hypothetical protein MPSEU_000939800 [Mayamaea pseudoterrestris]